MSAQTVGPNHQSCLQRASHCALVSSSLIPAQEARAEHAGETKRLRGRGALNSSLGLCLSHGIHQQCTTGQTGVSCNVWSMWKLLKFLGN